MDGVACVPCPRYFSQFGFSVNRSFINLTFYDFIFHHTEGKDEGREKTVYQWAFSELKQMKIFRFNKCTFYWYAKLNFHFILDVGNDKSFGLAHVKGEGPFLRLITAPQRTSSSINWKLAQQQTSQHWYIKLNTVQLIAVWLIFVAKASHSRTFFGSYAQIIIPFELGLLLPTAW